MIVFINAYSMQVQCVQFKLSNVILLANKSDTTAISDPTHNSDPTRRKGVTCANTYQYNKKQEIFN